ncbi:MAG: hypothetical protein ACJA0H_001634, partial [Francisellaceae bacterium]
VFILVKIAINDYSAIRLLCPYSPNCAENTLNTGLGTST